MKVSEFEERIDKEYTYDCVKEITHRGIKLSDCELLFEDCKKVYIRRNEKAIGGRDYVADKNCLTDPMYMKFVVKDEVYIILLPTGKEYWQMIGQIKDAGYETFDLS